LKAVLYDIHGNLPALEAVLADARAAGASGYVLGGDYALAGAYPRETVERLRELDASWIRGNTERWVAGDESDIPDSQFLRGLLRYCRGALLDDAGVLAALPAEVEEGDVLFCHGSPGSDMRSLGPEPTDNDPELLRGADQRVIVFGHTHLQFMRAHEGRLLVNPGSVGLPFDRRTSAAYALWGGDAQFELRRVAYDHASYASVIRERMRTALEDRAETLAAEVEQASMLR
jgi:putative phosphoesterase